MKVSFDVFFDADIADQLIKKAVIKKTSVQEVVNDLIVQGLNENQNRKEGFDQGVNEMMKVINDLNLLI